VCHDEEQLEVILRTLTLAIISTFFLTGCTTANVTEVIEEQPQDIQEQSMGQGFVDLESCDVFQEIVWAQDNTPEEASLVLLDGKTRLLTYERTPKSLVDRTLEYIDLTEVYIGLHTGSGNFLEVMKRFFAFYDVQQISFRDECLALDYEIYDDQYLNGTEETSASLDQERTATAAPSGNREKCFESMRLAAGESNSTIAERYLKETAEYCGGKSEWYEALRMHPYAMGFPDVRGSELEIVCYAYASTPACSNP